MEHERALEGWSLLTAAAAITERLQLGLLVTGNTYRNPALLAKMAATIDQISHGRLILGIGAAWFKREHEAYGWTSSGLKERCDRLEEALEVIKLLFTEGNGGFADYDGCCYQLDNCPLSPPCYQERTCRYSSAANGEKRTLKTCANTPTSATSTSTTPAARMCSATRSTFSNSTARPSAGIPPRSRRPC